MSINKIETNSSPIRYTKFDKNIPIKSPMKSILSPTLQTLPTLPLPTLTPTPTLPTLTPTPSTLTPTPKPTLPTTIKKFFKKNYLILTGVSVLILVISLSLYFGLKPSTPTPICDINNLNAQIASLSNDIEYLNTKNENLNSNLLTYTVALNENTDKKIEDFRNLYRDKIGVPDTVPPGSVTPVTPTYNTSGTINEAINKLNAQISLLLLKSDTLNKNNDDLRQKNKDYLLFNEAIEKYFTSLSNFNKSLASDLEYINKISMYNNSIFTKDSNLNLDNFTDACNNDFEVYINIFIIFTILCPLFLFYLVYHHFSEVKIDGGSWISSS